MSGRLAVSARAVGPWTWERAIRDHCQLADGVRLLLLLLHSGMNNDGRTWPSQQTIAAYARASVSTVQRRIEKAARAGWIGVELSDDHEGQGRNWRHNVYRACVPDAVPLKTRDEEKISDYITAKWGRITSAQDGPGNVTQVTSAHEAGNARGNVTQVTSAQQKVEGPGNAGVTSKQKIGDVKRRLG